MTFTLHLRQEAELDLEDAAFWYEEQNTGLGYQFLDEAQSILSAIAETPLIFPVVHKSTRCALMRRFPFGVYFQVDSSGVMVVAVMHGSRSPARWKSRN